MGHTSRWKTPLGTAVSRLPRLQYSMMIQVSTSSGWASSAPVRPERGAPPPPVLVSLLAPLPSAEPPPLPEEESSRLARRQETGRRVLLLCCTRTVVCMKVRITCGCTCDTTQQLDLPQYAHRGRGLLPRGLCTQTETGCVHEKCWGLCWRQVPGASSLPPNALQ